MRRKSGPEVRQLSSGTLTVTLWVPGYHEFVFSADSIHVPTADGARVIEPGHRRLDITVDVGVLTVRAGAKEWLAALHGGRLRADDDQVRLVAETLEFAERIDVGRARAAQADAAQRLESDRADTEAHAALRRANLRLAVAARVHPDPGSCTVSPA